MAFVMVAAEESREREGMKVAISKMTEDALTLTLVELHWLDVSLSGQVEKEEIILEILENTWHLAEDWSYHEQQVAAQKRILEGYNTLVGKIRRQMLWLNTME